jgi:hypothetical protein
MDSIEQKITQLCLKYRISESLLREAIAKEKQKIAYKNRQMSPEIVKLIEQYVEVSSFTKEEN